MRSRPRCHSDITVIPLQAMHGSAGCPLMTDCPLRVLSHCPLLRLLDSPAQLCDLGRVKTCALVPQFLSQCTDQGPNLGLLPQYPDAQLDINNRASDCSVCHNWSHPRRGPLRQPGGGKRTFHKGCHCLKRALRVLHSQRRLTPGPRRQGGDGAALRRRPSQRGACVKRTHTAGA